MARASVSFDLLDEQVRRWVWRQGWTSLKEIQENSIPVVLGGKSDVIISASTAGGKTEAVFLPILTSILQNRKHFGYQVLYISPLKALINDQYRRLSDMTAEMGIDVIPWHGDIANSRKGKSLKNPHGIVIITPESLESFLINKERFVKAVFSSLQYVVIDELHSFIGTERGKQLQSLLSRVEYSVHRTIPRIAMSATFSDYSAVKSFLRNNGSFPCIIPSPGQNDHEIRVLVKEYVNTIDENVVIPISQDLYNNLRGSNNLVFANTRIDVETYAIHLSDMCDKNEVPNEFRVHHGSISKMEREFIESEIKDGQNPITAICTSTLELGVDIGKVKSIAQIGMAFSVSGLRQRLGRSGRRDEPSILRVYSIDDDSDGLLYDLRSGLVHNIAAIELMREHKYETPTIKSYHFSTLVQQILALVAQCGSFYPKDGWAVLCKSGAFPNVSPIQFLEILKSLGDNRVISQLNTGQIVIGPEGEKILKLKDFYVAFNSTPDLVVINRENSKRIGVIQYIPDYGKVIILAGRRWFVDSYDEKTAVVYVSQIKSGGAFMFNGIPGAEIDNIIANKMREIYQSNELYAYLDKQTEAVNHLKNARSFFQMSDLVNTSFLLYGNNNFYMTWAGTKVNRTIALLARYYLNRQCDYCDLFVSNLTSDDVMIISQIQNIEVIDLVSILPREEKLIQKYDYLLSDSLLNAEYANTYLVDANTIKF